MKPIPSKNTDLLDSIGSAIEIARQNAVKVVNIELVKANGELVGTMSIFEKKQEQVLRFLLQISEKWSFCNMFMRNIFITILFCDGKTPNVWSVYKLLNHKKRHLHCLLILQ